MLSVIHVSAPAFAYSEQGKNEMAIDSLRERNFSTIHDASSTGESFKPGARLFGFGDWINA